MAGSAPLRLDADLVRAASAAAQLHKRSTPRQIEYWAEIGREVEKRLSAEDVLALREGLARLIVERGALSPVEPDEVLAAIDTIRRSGELTERVCESRVRYQSAPRHPGLLERIDPEGSRELGTFRNGEFVPVSK
jgi:hypothetical protein